MHGLYGDTGSRRVADTVALVELEDASAQRVGDYSTGMAKRLALACALLPEPSLLVLDEPFESLDPLMVRRLARTLRARRDAGTAVLLSLHLLAMVAELCDRVVLLSTADVFSRRVLCRRWSPPMPQQTSQRSLLHKRRSRATRDRHAWGRAAS